MMTKLDQIIKWGVYASFDLTLFVLFLSTFLSLYIFGEMVFFFLRGREMVFIQLFCDNFLTIFFLILTLFSFYVSSFYQFLMQSNTNKTNYAKEN